MNDFVVFNEFGDCLFDCVDWNGKVDFSVGIRWVVDCCVDVD